jgi:seryl-tRNA synthetase
MLDAKFIRDNEAVVLKALKDRHSSFDITPVIRLEAERRDLMARVEDLKRVRNEASKAIGLKKRNKENADAEMAR